LLCLAKKYLQELTLGLEGETTLLEYSENEVKKKEALGRLNFNRKLCYVTITTA
jgi:hypothetical protein